MFPFSKKKKFSPEIAMSPLRFQVVTAEEFLKIYAEKNGEIRSVKIIPPKLGNKDFGKVLIEWKNPVYVPLSELSEAFA